MLEVCTAWHKVLHKLSLLHTLESRIHKLEIPVERVNLKNLTKTRLISFWSRRVKTHQALHTVIRFQYFTE